MYNSNELLKGKKYAPAKLGDICVLGLGKTGYVVANYCAELLGTRANSVTVYAGKKTVQAMKQADSLIKMGVCVIFDEENVSGRFSLCITSPGIPIVSDFYKSAANCSRETISEVEFAWRESNFSTKWVAITGTNGKTTTTSLTTEILQQTGRHTIAVGNIGNVALEAVALSSRKSVYERTDIYVVEVSSYQLACTNMFSPDIAVLLNITPDHIGWHGSFEAYKEAKLKIFDHAKSAVVNIDDAEVADSMEAISKLVSPVLTIKNSCKNNIYGKTEDYYVDVEYRGMLHRFVKVDRLRMYGEHSVVDARAAASVGVLFGLEDIDITHSLMDFKPLEHRLEPCGTVSGINCYNDSKATNVDASLVAIKSFKPEEAIFLFGGKDKNTDLSDLVRVAYRCLGGVVCFGEAADRFYEAFEEYDKNAGIAKFFYIEKEPNMETAFKRALEIAKPGMSVVLSPACSSFDEFKSFEDRGEAFKKLCK